MRKFFVKYGSTIGAAMMGLNLAVCGITFMQWKYWLLFFTAFLWAGTAYFQGEEKNAAAAQFHPSPFDPDSICGACGRLEREHTSCPTPVAQKR